MLLCFGRTSKEVFVMLLFFIFDLHFVVVSSFYFWSSFNFASSFLIFICRCSSFCCSSFKISFLRYSSPFRGLSRVFLTPYFILLAQPIAGWFATHLFSTIPLISLPRALRSWVDIFYPEAFFTFCSFNDILICVYQGFPWSWQFFLEVYRASYWSLKHRPSPSVSLIHSNPQFWYSERFTFKFYHISAWIACGESSIYLLLIRFKLFSLVQSIYKDY